MHSQSHNICLRTQGALAYIPMLITALKCIIQAGKMSKKWVARFLQCFFGGHSPDHHSSSRGQ